jgi:hypothetical protein
MQETVKQRMHHALSRGLGIKYRYKRHGSIVLEFVRMSSHMMSTSHEIEAQNAHAKDQFDLANGSWFNVLAAKLPI